LLIILSLTTSVSAIPMIPHAFYGEVKINGEIAPDGTKVEAFIGGIVYGSTITVDGKYGWDPTFKIPADDKETEEKDGGVDGETIEFYVEGFWARNYNFKNGDVTELDLSVELVELSQVTPEPPTNETESYDDVVMLMTELEEVKLKIESMKVDLENLTREFFLLQTAYNLDVKVLKQRIWYTQIVLLVMTFVMVTLITIVWKKVARM